uniref:Uncharacterized protein n=1 Tax=Megaselia scalaris TaxID=36166 RepID=T1GIJ7_MEGSC
MFLHILRLILQ